MLYGLRHWPGQNDRRQSCSCPELKVLRFSFGVTGMEEIRNENIGGTAQAGGLGEEVRETRLRLVEHVQRAWGGFQEKDKQED